MRRSLPVVIRRDFKFDMTSVAVVSLFSSRTLPPLLLRLFLEGQYSQSGIYFTHLLVRPIDQPVQTTGNAMHHLHLHHPPPSPRPVLRASAASSLQTVEREENATLCIYIFLYFFHECHAVFIRYFVRCTSMFTLFLPQSCELRPPSPPSPPSPPPL